MDLLRLDSEPLRLLAQLHGQPGTHVRDAVDRGSGCRRVGGRTRDRRAVGDHVGRDRGDVCGLEGPATVSPARRRVSPCGRGGVGQSDVGDTGGDGVGGFIRATARRLPERTISTKRSSCTARFIEQFARANPMEARAAMREHIVRAQRAFALEE